MATKTTTALEDDLEGGPAEETVRFSLGGTECEIGLNTNNATVLRGQLAPCTGHPGKAGGRQRRPPRTASNRQHSASIRARAQNQGIVVSTRGCIPACAGERYEAAA